MNIIRFLKPFVFTLECVKLVVIVIVMTVQGDASGLFVKIILAAPGVLFPLMALFVWLDAERYKEYLPLFSAGKYIGIFLLLVWLIVFRQVTIIGKIFGSDIYAETLLLCGDLLSLGAVTLIRNIKNPEMEEN